MTLAEPILSSLRDEHFTCLNHAMMMRLGTIGQAFLMRLFFHFANHYDGRNPRQLKFEKRYDDICAEWLGGLTVLKYRCHIVDKQLGRHLDQLIAEDFLASYGIAKAKGRDGFVLTFRPGQAFFRDYDRFYRQRRQGDLQFAFHEDKREISEPLRVAYLFAEKRTGQTVASVPFASTKDKETARLLLAELSFAEMPAFLDFALAEARRSNFPVQTLGGIRQYLPAYLAVRERRARESKRALAREVQEREDAELRAYDHDRRQEASRVFETLPFKEQGVIENLATEKSASFSGSLRENMVAFNRIRFTIERHSADLKTLAEWRADRRVA